MAALATGALGRAGAFPAPGRPSRPPGRVRHVTRAGIMLRIYDPHGELVSVRRGGVRKLTWLPIDDKQEEHAVRQMNRARAAYHRHAKLGLCPPVSAR